MKRMVCGFATKVVPSWSSWSSGTKGMSVGVTTRTSFSSNDLCFTIIELASSNAFPSLQLHIAFSDRVPCPPNGLFSTDCKFNITTSLSWVLAAIISAIASNDVPSSAHELLMVVLFPLGIVPSRHNTFCKALLLIGGTSELERFRCYK